MLHSSNIHESVLLKTIMDTSPNIIIITDGSKMLFCNHKVLSFFGYASIESFSEKHACISDFFEPYTQEAILKRMGELPWFEHVLSHPDEPNHVYLKKDNIFFTFKIYTQKMLIEGTFYYIAILNDITETQLQKERYAQAIEGANVGLWDWWLQSEEVYFSPQWKAILGFKDDEFPNTLESWKERVHPEDLTDVLKRNQDNIDKKNDFYQTIYRMRHKDGHWVWIDARGKSYFDTLGTPTRMVGIHTDISPLKESEAHNERNAKRSAALLQLPQLSETLSEADFMQKALELSEELTHSPISFIHFINDGEKSIELVTWSSRTLKEYCHAVHVTHYPVEQAGIWADALRQHKTIIVNDYASYAQKKGLPEGHAHLERFISVPVMENNKVVMLCGIGNKTTHYDDSDIESLQLIANDVWQLVQRKRNLIKLKYTQELLVSQSRNAAMGEMVSMIAHQWRQPISIIGMCANNMLLDIQLEDISPIEFEKHTRDILSQTEHLSLTINDFRNFFKPSKYKESILIQEVLDDALKLIEKSFQQDDILLSIRNTSHSEILIYKRELLQVLLNILKNAKEAIEEKQITNGLITVRIEENESTIKLSISDNAGGVSEENIKHIFEPYFSTKEEKNGTGLGLYMCKTIVEKHFNGSLSVLNKEEGACFNIVLPKTISA